MPKPKVLVVNKYHFISGGAERYFMKVMDAMRERDIEPIPFSVNYEKTLPSPYQKYFLEPVLKGGAAKIQLAKPSWKDQITLAGNAIYNWEAKKAIRALARDHRPDLAYFLNFNNHISPSAIDACDELGIPVVMRMSDYNLTCAANMYYRDGHPCRDCKHGLHHALLNRCVHGSVPRSLVQVFANSLHRWMSVYKKVRAFIAPTEFMRQELLDLGFDPARVHQVDTFVKPCRETPAVENDDPYILFIGRFVPYKGVEASIRAFSKLPEMLRRRVTLKLAGDENDEESARLKKIAGNLTGSKIEFLPFERDAKKLHDLTHRALFTLVPSEFYDNLPNTILESFACGRPVIATRLGSMIDIVKDEQYGLLFEYGSLEDFSQKMQRLIEGSAAREEMGKNAYEAVLRDYSEDRHMEKILSIFQGICPQFSSVSPVGISSVSL